MSRSALIVSVVLSTLLTLIPAFPLHQHKVTNTATHHSLPATVALSTDLSTEHNIDNVGPALFNATQTAIKRGEEILANYTSLLYGIAIPTGLAASFFGYFLLAPVLFLAAFVTGGGACFIAIGTVLEDTPTGAWISIGAMLLGGALFGFIAMRALSIGMFAVGAALGVVFASAVRTTLIAETFPKNPRTAFIIVAVVLGLLLGLLALLFEKHMLIFSTAYAGACGCVFGIGHFAGHFPTTEELSKVEAGSVNGWVLLYLGMTILLGTAGMFFQFWLARDKTMPEYAPYDRRRRRRSGRRYERPPFSDDDDDWGTGAFVERAPLPPRRKREPAPRGYIPAEEYDDGRAVERVYEQAARRGVDGDQAAKDEIPAEEGSYASWKNVQEAGSAFGVKSWRRVDAEQPPASSVPDDGGSPLNVKDTEEDSNCHGKENNVERRQIASGKGIALKNGSNKRNLFSDDDDEYEDEDNVTGDDHDLAKASPTTLVDVPLGSDNEATSAKV